MNRSLVSAACCLVCTWRAPIVPGPVVPGAPVRQVLLRRPRQGPRARPDGVDVEGAARDIRLRPGTSGGGRPPSYGRPAMREHRDLFWYDWGPVFYRGRLNGTARLLGIASDPGPTERVVCRTLVGDAGQRVQGFLTSSG